MSDQNSQKSVISSTREYINDRRIRNSSFVFQSLENEQNWNKKSKKQYKQSNLIMINWLLRKNNLILDKKKEQLIRSTKVNQKQQRFVNSSYWNYLKSSLSLFREIKSRIKFFHLIPKLQKDFVSKRFLSV
ncbi:unnamed protein product [Paramecium octaurelia]|uniref:Uncharacterized protein n=1 Tax=Paramecium octaurelia TaxID=43137 RepID=A0A8S1X7Z7_PAROT|nr:unnamed protein product [Paramecium octaurelia]